MESSSYEARVNLAIEAIRINEKPCLRAAAKIYHVKIGTLRNRRAGKPSRCDISPNLRKLTDLEEKTVVEYIVDLTTYSFPPRLRSVGDIVNELFYTHATHRLRNN